MKIGRLLILLGAAGAGSMVYKARTFFTEPGTSSIPGQEIYSSLTGPGSLAHTWAQGTQAREEALEADIHHAPVTDGGYGSALSFKNEKNETVQSDLELINAAARGDIAKVESRLTAQAKVDSRDSLRRTPLMYASWNGHMNIASRLIAAGANPEFQDRDGNNAYDYAAGRGLVDELQYLLTRTRVDDTRAYEEYAQLIRAAFASKVAKLPGTTKQKLVSINRLNPEGQAPLHIAAGNGAVDMMKALITRGADANLSNGNKQTPLHWAAWNNKTEAIKILLHYGADVRQQDLAGNSPLIFAAQNGSADAVVLLLKSGSDRYTANKDGKTASMVAKDNGFHDLANLLH